MSEARTVEIISRHTGKVRFKCKGEPRVIYFDERGDIGVGMATNDEAEVLLGVGLPDFWKTAAVVVEKEKEKEKKNGNGKEKVADVIAKIQAATTTAEVAALIEGEDRPSVLSVAEIKNGELDVLEKQPE